MCNHIDIQKYITCYRHCNIILYRYTFFYFQIFYFDFSYSTKDVCEHGTAKNPRRSDLYVLVHGRMWPSIWFGKEYYKLYLYIYVYLKLGLSLYI